MKNLDKTLNLPAMKPDNLKAVCVIGCGGQDSSVPTATELRTVGIPDCSQSDCPYLSEFKSKCRNCPVLINTKHF